MAALWESPRCCVGRRTAMAKVPTLGMGSQLPLSSQPLHVRPSAVPRQKGMAGHPHHAETEGAV